MYWSIFMRAFSARLFLSSRRAVLGIMATLVVCVLSPDTPAALVQIAPPPSVLQNALESQVNMFLFLESEQVLAAPLAVDISIPGFYDINNPDSPGVIPAGTHIRSYFLHVDPIFLFPSFQIGAFNSPTKILGLITTDAKLDATDALLGNPGTLYPTGLAFRSPELYFPITPDAISFNANQVTLSFISVTAAVVDQLRIIAVVPEPGTLTLAVVGAALGMVGLRRRMKTPRL